MQYVLDDPLILLHAQRALLGERQRIDDSLAKIEVLLGKKKRGRPPRDQNAAAALAMYGPGVLEVPQKRRGRPPGSKNVAPAKKRTISPEGLAAIKKAAKKRWAAKTAAKKAAPATAKKRKFSAKQVEAMRNNVRKSRESKVVQEPEVAQTAEAAS